MEHGPTTHRRRLARAVVLLVVGLSLLGCGEEEPGPTTGERYCEAYRDFFDERAAHGADVTDAEVVRTLKGWGRDLERIGPPDDMSEEARAGYRIWVDLISQVEDDATREDVVALEAGLTKAQLEQVEAFFAYNDGSCLGSPPV